LWRLPVLYEDALVMKMGIDVFNYVVSQVEQILMTTFA
jgi:hypothetical protein